VEERLAADGADLAGAEEARYGVAAQQFADCARVVVWGGEEARPAPVAGEEESAGGTVAVDRVGQVLAQVLVGRVGVAHVEAERLADADGLGDRERTGVLVHAHQPAHQIVAAAVFGAVLVDHQARQHAAAGRTALLVLGHAREVVLQPLERGLPGELEDDVALGVGDHGVAADRLAALGDHRPDRHAAQHGADRALVDDLAVDEQRLCVRLAAARGQAADERGAVFLLVQLREEACGWKAERVDEQRYQVGALELGKARDRDPLVCADRKAVERLDLGAGQRSRPDGGCGPALEFPSPRHDALGHAAQQVPRRELLLDRCDRLVAGREVVGRQEEERQVDRGAAGRRTRTARGLAGRLRRRGRDGQPRPDPARARPGAHGRSVRLAGSLQDGSEICSTTSPVRASSSCLATSAWETMPTSRPSSSTTGSRRTLCCAISRSPSSSSCCGSTVTRSVEAISRTVAEPGSRPSAISRTTMSRSVTVPISFPFSTTGTIPVSRSRMVRAASTTEAPGSTVVGLGVMTSLMLLPIRCLLHSFRLRFGFPALGCHKR
jgi:hypothetical protein